MRSSTLVKFVATALLGLGVVAAMATYVQMAGISKVPDSQRRGATPEVSVKSSKPKTPEQKGGAYVADPVYHGDDLNFEKRSTQVPLGEDAKVHVINEFLQRTKIADASAKLLSVEVKDGLANLYFNAAFQQTMGSDDEAVLINGIAVCLGQFKDVDRFQCYADGQQVETLGHFDLTEPTPVKHLDSSASH